MTRQEGAEHLAFAREANPLGPFGKLKCTNLCRGTATEEIILAGFAGARGLFTTLHCGIQLGHQRGAIRAAAIHRARLDQRFKHAAIHPRQVYSLAQFGKAGVGTAALALLYQCL